MSASEPTPVVAEVLWYEDLQLSWLASRRAAVRWSDGTEGEALRWYGDEISVCAGDLIGKTREQLRSPQIRCNREWLHPDDVLEHSRFRSSCPALSALPHKPTDGAPVQLLSAAMSQPAESRTRNGSRPNPQPPSGGL